MHDDDKEIGKNYTRQKRKVGEGNEQAINVFGIVNISMLQVSRIELQRKMIIEFQKEDVITPDTARDSGENDMVQEFSSNSFKKC